MGWRRCWGQVNTYVYVEGLPTDTSEKEVPLLPTRTFPRWAQQRPYIACAPWDLLRQARVHARTRRWQTSSPSSGCCAPTTPRASPSSSSTGLIFPPSLFPDPLSSSTRPVPPLPRHPAPRSIPTPGWLHGWGGPARSGTGRLGWLVFAGVTERAVVWQGRERAAQGGRTGGFPQGGVDPARPPARRRPALPRRKGPPAPRSCCRRVP